MAMLPTRRERRLVESGKFEYETHLSRHDVAEFLRNLAEQIEKGLVDITSEEWEIQFEFTDPIEVEVEFNGDRKKLEIELTFKKRGSLSARVE